MIKRFTGLYAFLSNFYSCNVVVDGILYPSVEHAYQAHKSDDIEWQRICQDRTIRASDIRRMSQSVKPVPDWNIIKLDVMRKCLRAKFSKEPLKTMLLDTGLRELQEGNWWGDKYWGVDLDTGVGQNHLGKLLMEVRDELFETVYKNHY